MKCCRKCSSLNWDDANLCAVCGAELDSVPIPRGSASIESALIFACHLQPDALGSYQSLEAILSDVAPELRANGLVMSALEAALPFFGGDERESGAGLLRDRMTRGRYPYPEPIVEDIIEALGSVRKLRRGITLGSAGQDAPGREPDARIGTGRAQAPAHEGATLPAVMSPDLRECEAMCERGDRLLGEGAWSGSLEAYGLFRDAALRGYHPARQKLEGLLATSLSRKLCDEGDALLRLPDGPDRGGAFALYERAAQASDFGPAEYRLGYCLLRGIGVEQDRPKAIAHFEKAVGLGCGEAAYAIGYCHMFGLGVNQDIDRFREYLDLAQSMKCMLGTEHKAGMTWPYPPTPGTFQDIHTGGYHPEMKKQVDIFLQSLSSEVHKRIHALQLPDEYLICITGFDAQTLKNAGDADYDAMLGSFITLALALGLKPSLLG